MPQFTKKPVTIEAVMFSGIEAGKPQFRDDISQPAYTIQSEACPEWLQVAMAKGATSESGIFVRGMGGESWGASQELVLMVKTLEGEMVANPGDWIIQGIAGEIYPCKPDIFAESYVPAVPAAPTSTSTPSKKASS